jgi:hypothetical protein
MWLDDSSHTMKTIEQKRDFEGEFHTVIDDRKIDITFFPASFVTFPSELYQCGAI